MERNVNEVAEVFRRGYHSYKSGKKLPLRIKKVAKDIMECRTAKMGGHKLECTKCGDVQYSYNSCKNRHCPKCQFSKREQWILDRNRDLLPVSYFHVIFTVPHELNDVHIRHPEIMYDLLFDASWQSISKVVSDQYRQQVKMGMIAVLHSWGQSLSVHPHVHCIIPSGVYDKAENRWIGPKRHNLLCSIEKLTELYKQVYIKKLNKLQKINRFVNDEAEFKSLIDKVASKVFNVNIQPAFANPQHVIEYLGRYSHRVAITNSRIESVSETHVTFTYKDYRDQMQKEMTLTTEEFIDRFLKHTLPDRFMKIRHYGILSNKVKNECIEAILVILQTVRNPKQIFDVVAFFAQRFDIDLKKCPKCQSHSPRQNEMIHKARSDPDHFLNT